MAETVTKAEEQLKEHSRRVVYELGYHIVPKAGDEQLPKAVAAIKAEVEKIGGTFIAEEFPVHVTLAYTMMRSLGGTREKFASTYFGWIKFEMDVENANSFQEWLRVNELILRFVLFRTAREDTRAPKRVTVAPKSPEPIRPKLTPVVKENKPTERASDEDLDRTIEQLVIE